MIRELRIRNLALIDDVALELEDGFSVLTGETGAGKSILIGAIGLLLGDRASSEYIRSGFDEGEVNGVFELSSLPDALAKQLTENAITPEENTLIVRRTISRGGRNRIHVNQVPVPLSTLKAIGDHLVDLHGQHEHQSLLKPDTARLLIDSLPSVAPLLASYRQAYHHYCTLRQKLQDHDRRAAELAERRELIEFQYRELESLHLQPGEEEQLEQEHRMLSSATQRVQCVAAIQTSIEGDGDSEGMDRRIADIHRHLETLERFDPRATPWKEQVDGIVACLSELSAFCASYIEDDGDGGASPARLDEINSRLARIQRLKKKHHCSAEELVEKQQALKSDLDSLMNVAADRTQLERQVRQAEKACTETGDKLSGARRTTAGGFDKQITRKMASLGFSEGQWRTAFEAEEQPGPHGLESVNFQVRTNPGEPFMPLIKTASGGEISRLMLAIKTVLSEIDQVPVLIFDEIDTGIGGHLAKEVARSLYELSRNHQVLCISHLHQIASSADHHYSVFKQKEKQRTVTRVRRLTDGEKVTEVARMLGGDTETARKHAEELVRARKK
jgi:DNA repair protein RecN (Recombination protein N)